MSDLLEVVFERVPPAEVGGMLRRIAGDGSVVTRIEAAPPLEASDDPPVLRVERWVESGVDGVVMLALEQVTVGSYALSQPMVRVLRYETHWDVELNFDLADVTISDGDDFVRVLQAFSGELAAAHGVATYFAGLEPAADEDTRFFTGTDLGPLSAANLGT